MVRVEQAEQDPWLQRRKRGGKNSRRPIPSEDVNSTGAFRSIPPVPLDTQRTAFEQREAVAQVQDALGVPSKQIAQELGVSEATVQRYLRTPEQRAESAAKSTTPTARSRNSQTSGCATPRTGTSRTCTAASGTPFGQTSLRHRPKRPTKREEYLGITTIPSRQIHSGVRRQAASPPMEEHSTGRDGPVVSEPPTTSARENSGATIASRRPVRKPSSGNIPRRLEPVDK